jgi:hypothetical protein
MLRNYTDEEGFKILIMHWKKARAIYNLVGMKDNAHQMDTKISLCTANKQAGNEGNISTAEKNSLLEFARDIYERCCLGTQGMNSETTISTGLNYAEMLWGVNRQIEAGRLGTKLATVSRRVLGPDHNVTNKADELLEKCKKRCVTVLPDYKQFEALRYENDGEICVVQGPLLEPRNIADERMYHIANTLVIPNKGCPVICHGLVIAPRLNGELGEVRNVKQDGTGIIRFGVVFEKKGTKSALVKPENLRIAFDLPRSEE